MKYYFVVCGIILPVHFMVLKLFTLQLLTLISQEVELNHTLRSIIQNI